MADSFAPFSLAAALLLQAAAGLQAAESPPTELPVLMTESGRDYVEVQILQFDPEGPIFRHRDGIAKLRYQEIREKTRKLLGYPRPAPAIGPATAPVEPAPEPGITLYPVRVTTHWVLYAPVPAPYGPRPLLHPWWHHQAAWPFEDPFRPFAAVDLMVVGGVVPHPGWHGPHWIW